MPALRRSRRAYKIAANPAKRVRYGLWKCRDCRKQLTWKVGTVFEHARVPLHKALQATYLLCSSKKGISSNQLSRPPWIVSLRVVYQRRGHRDLRRGRTGGGIVAHPASLTQRMMCWATATSVPSCLTTLMSARDCRFTGSISLIV
jgi:transposase-like protein